MEELFNLIGPYWGTIVIIILVIGVLILMSKKRMLFKFGNLMISSQEDLESSFNQTIRLATEISEIRFRKRKSEQVALCRNAVKYIKKLMLDNYAVLLEKKGIIDKLSHSVYKEYEKILFVLMFELREDCEDTFDEMADIFKYEKSKNVDKKNKYDLKRFTDYVKQVHLCFEEYKTNTATSLVEDAKTIITREWIKNDIITREEARDIQLPIIPEIEKLIFKMLDGALEIHFKYEEIIKELNEELDSISKCLKK